MYIANSRETTKNGKQKKKWYIYVCEYLHVSVQDIYAKKQRVKNKQKKGTKNKGKIYRKL